MARSLALLAACALALVGACRAAWVARCGTGLQGSAGCDGGLTVRLGACAAPRPPSWYCATRTNFNGVSDTVAEGTLVRYDFSDAREVPLLYLEKNRSYRIDEVPDNFPYWCETSFTYVDLFCTATGKRVLLVYDDQSETATAAAAAQVCDEPDYKVPPPIYQVPKYQRYCKWLK